MAVSFASFQGRRREGGVMMAPSRTRLVAEAKAAEAARVLESLAAKDTLDSLVGNGTLIRERWDTYSLDRQHAIIRAILPSATIAAGSHGRGNFDPDRVQPHWAA